MAGLQVLEDTFKSNGFEVLGFISDDFGDQGGTTGQVDACSSQYHVTFDQFAKDHVIDPDGAGPEVPEPVFDWLISQPNPGPAPTAEPTWNFHKYLVARDGTLVAHFPRELYPGDDPADPNDSFDGNPIVIAIKAELAK
jgi:glutathione peroxidase